MAGLGSEPAMTALKDAWCLPPSDRWTAGGESAATVPRPARVLCYASPLLASAAVTLQLDQAQQ